MAIYHLSVKPISRSAGRSATAAAAYRAGCEIVDQRTGLVHDYSRKRGVESADVVLPAGAPAALADRAALWNAAEAAERRKDACVAREYEVALPHELSADQARQLALDFARQLAERHGCAVDVCMHAPSGVSDQRNRHAHIMATTRQAGPDGLAGKCAIEQAGRNRRADLEATRELWAETVNRHLERAGQAARVDHRSLAAQGIDREPTQHLGPAATGYERRTGDPSWLRQVRAREAAQARLEAAAKAAQEAAPIDAEVIDLETRLRALLDERRDRQKVAVHLLGQWQTYLKDRPGPEVARVADAMRAITAREPGALERGEDLTRAIRAREVAALERAEAARQAEAHSQRLEAERAAKRAAEAELLASLRTPSPASRISPAGQAEDYIAARRREREQAAETRAPEPRGTDQEQQLLERQKREAEAAKEAPEQDQEQDHGWGMDGP